MVYGLTSAVRTFHREQCRWVPIAWSVEHSLTPSLTSIHLMYHSFSAPLSNPSVHIPLYWHRLALGFEASKAELADLVIAAGTKREEKRESRENAERKERNNTAHTKRSKLKPVHDSPCLSVVNPPPPQLLPQSLSQRGGALEQV